jgi:TonB family protein
MAQAATTIYRLYDLPWSTGREQERRFKRLLAGMIGGSLLAALLLSFLPVPARNQSRPEAVPKRFARLLLEPKPAPPPPVVREHPQPVRPKPKAKPKSKPEPVRAAPKAKSAAPKPRRPTAAERARQARARASSAGLLPLAGELASLRDENDTQRFGRADLKKPGAGTGAAPATERSLITSRVGRSSGGINTAKLSRNVGGAGLAGRATTRVENPVAGIGADGGDGAAAGGRGGADGRGSRSREEIERVFDRNKGAIYALYNRALRRDPTLQGKLVLRLTIAPDGRVTHCEVVSSELGDRELERKLVARVLLFKFDPKDVDTVTTTKPIDFFPA